HMGDLLAKVKPDGNLLAGVGADTGMQSMSMPGMANSGGFLFNPAANAFTFNIENSIISNKLTDRSAFEKTLSGDSSLQMIKQIIPMMGDLNY
ncbi:hypothetical protein ACR80T_05660, partial [Escherichia coli]|uniref:hypothetical protein n=1 Tax=Escherichia coli TaxID=562 RepID=UPI00405A28BF